MAHAWRSIVSGFGMLLLLSTAAPAAVPNALSFQGLLKDSTGTPYSGSKLVKFSIYDSLGTEIWTSGFSSQIFSGGLVNVPLGAPPQPPLPTAALLGDTSLTLGITVDTDPEVSPRIRLSSAPWAIHAGDADRLDGLEGSSFVQETGDTMSGSLAVMGSLSVGTDTSYTGLSLRSGSNWSWFINHGWGDFRIGDEFIGFSIGIALGGGGAGATRMWSRGGVAEDIYFGGPTTGDLLRLKGKIKEVEFLGDVGIGTGSIVAPLTLQSKDQYRWDIGSGMGDFRLTNGAAGFSMGVTSVGDVALWSGGGGREQFTFGGPTRGAVLKIDADLQRTFNWGYSEWRDSLGSPKIQLSPYTDGLRMFGDGYTAAWLFTYGASGGVGLFDSGRATVNMYSSSAGRSGVVQLRRTVPSGVESYGVSLNAGADSVGGQIVVHDGLGNPKITFDADNDSDLSVMLPTSAINHDEILDEPGIAFNRRTSLISGLAKSGTSQNFVSVQITIPADGYIVVDGVGYFQCIGDTAFGWIQISETSNRAQEAGHFNWISATRFANDAGGYSYQSIPVKRFYMKSKGTYTLYLQGNAYTGNSASSTVSLLAPSWLQATYYPVSYGTASTLAESPGDFESATPVSITDPQTGETAQAYRVDLRDLELKAARARAELERAQRELLQAQMQKQAAANAEIQQATTGRVDNDLR